MTTKAELVTAIAEKAGINKNQAKDALEAFIDAVTDSCATWNRPLPKPRCMSAMKPWRVW